MMMASSAATCTIGLETNTAFWPYYDELFSAGMKNKWDARFPKHHPRTGS
jgi:hypothetical protein